jgi:hypothetical protein
MVKEKKSFWIMAWPIVFALLVLWDLSRGSPNALWVAWGGVVVGIAFLIY